MGDALSTREGLVAAALALMGDGSRLTSAERAAASASLPTVPRSVIQDLREQIADGGDPLGEAFCSLFSPADRRPAGATYTPPAVVAAMLGWAEDGPAPVRVVDPGAGSGRFSLSAARSFPQAELVAVENDPLAALLLRANLAIQGAKHATVVVDDYRRVALPPRDGRTLFVGNPPYVRHHQISPDWKRWLTTTAKSMGHTASQLAGLHVHFFLATVSQGASGDLGVFITSAEWLDVNYGALVRQLALDGLGVRSLQVITPEARVFDDAQTTAVITCFELGAKPASVRLKRVKKVDDLRRLQGGQPVRRERLAEARRWTPLLRSARAVPEGYVELGEFVHVHRGAVTGANRVWVVDPEAVDLPSSVLAASVTRARELIAAEGVLSDDRRLRAVVDLPPDLDELNEHDRPRVARFLRQARRLGAHEGYIARHRSAWWAVGLREPAPLLATYMARRVPAIVRNLVAARHINIAHGLYPRGKMSDAELARLAQAIRETVTLGHGRTYAGGLTKFEPRELERLLVPNVLEPA